MKKRDKKNVIPWGTTETILTESKKIIHVGFKNIIFVLGISTVLDMNKLVLRNHKKPSTTSTSAKTTRILFVENEYTKDLWIPQFLDTYNHKMGHMDQADQLSAYNPRLRPYCRGG
jgi:hypothetical protein